MFSVNPSFQSWCADLSRLNRSPVNDHVQKSELGSLKIHFENNAYPGQSIGIDCTRSLGCCSTGYDGGWFEILRG